MNHSKTESPVLISHKECTIKVISSKKVSGKINITVRLVKTPPSKPINHLNHPLPISEVRSPKLSIKIPTFINFPFSSTLPSSVKSQDPSDFIEPIPSIKDYISQSPDSELTDLCDTLPILPRAYSIRPSVALRNSIKRRQKTYKLLRYASPSPIKSEFIRR